MMCMLMSWLYMLNICYHMHYIYYYHCHSSNQVRYYNQAGIYLLLCLMDSHYSIVCMYLMCRGMLGMGICMASIYLCLHCLLINKCLLYNSICIAHYYLYGMIVYIYHIDLNYGKLGSLVHMAGSNQLRMNRMQRYYINYQVCKYYQIILIYLICMMYMLLNLLYMLGMGYYMANICYYYLQQ